MVIERKISRDKYILAGFLTFLIFSLGLSLGFLLDNMRVRWTENANKEREVDYNSLQFQYLYLSTLQEANESCSVMHTALEKSVVDLGESLGQLLEFQKQTKLNKKDYEVAGRKYLLDNLRYWLFAKKSKEKCRMNIVNVLYFYSTEVCTDCPKVGTLLTYYKKKLGDSLLIFPIDVDLAQKDVVIDILESRYNVTTYPTLIIEDEKHEGVIPKEELGNLICNSFENEGTCLSITSG